jgi:hypothetical protein
VDQVKLTDNRVTPKPPTGKWRLVEMEQWNQDLVDLEGPGFISFAKNGQGEMKFGAVSIQLNWGLNGDTELDFSFEGFDEMDEISGPGWAKPEAGLLVGRIRFHLGDSSKFTARKWKTAETA